MSPSKQSGFTLLEVLISLMIVAAAVVASSSLWSGNSLRIRKAATNYDLATLLERKMVEIEATYRDKSINEIPEQDGGDFGTDYPGFRWTMESKELVFPDLTPVIAAQQEGGDETIISMIKQLTEFMGKVMKEVKVTVYIKRGKRENKFSASQYFVDWNTDFAAPSGGSEDKPTDDQPPPPPPVEPK